MPSRFILSCLHALCALSVLPDRPVVGLEELRATSPVSGEAALALVLFGELDWEEGCVNASPAIGRRPEGERDTFEDAALRRASVSLRRASRASSSEV